MQNILVVDDQAFVRRILVHLLGLEGDRVTEAADGEEALKAIRGSSPPELCVLDVAMPRVDGWEVLREVRADPMTADLPVIMLTARGQPSERLRGWELGCDAYVRKPFDPPEVLQEIRAVLVRNNADRRANRERQMTVIRTMTPGSQRRVG